MAILAETTIPRSLDLLAVRCLGAGPGRRVEAWLFEDEAVRRGVEERLRAAGIEARLRSAYKPLLHFFLEEASLEGVTAVRIRYPVHAAANPLRFRMEAYPLAGLLGGRMLRFEPGGDDLHYEVGLLREGGGEERHRVFAPNRLRRDLLGRESLSPCGWWCRRDAGPDGQVVEDEAFETEYEAAFRLAMESLDRHEWGESGPCFGVLEMRVETGGIERPLSYGGECLSTREALHEDLYFSALEFCGARAGLPPGDRRLQPGQIVPDIWPGEGQTRLRVAIQPREMAEKGDKGSGRGAAEGEGELESAARPLPLKRIAQELEALPGERFEALSVQGRPVRGVHVPGETGIGLVVTAGQHANETSGVVGALRAARVLAGIGRLGFALIPLENPDGYALHERFRRVHPHHMHHAARYTALGDDLEVRDGPPWHEKAVRLEAFHRIGARLHVNLHGYPAHEWTRPLSGYLPRGFESWSIPRGFFLILRHGPGLDGMAGALMRHVAERIAAVPGLAAFNRRQAILYEAHLGEAPQPSHAGIPYSIAPRPRPGPPLALITEFPDETVEGEDFRLAHAVQREAVLAAAEWLEGGWNRVPVA